MRRSRESAVVFLLLALSFATIGFTQDRGAGTAWLALGVAFAVIGVVQLDDRRD
ncbi:hypothetical protein [Aeromicrobium alkaliterrae]|uniref:Uncharacterized protein n=1 Tax=Aeromicrobium alkaliterrae TaxID=302168 RepID=A0ABN2JGE7_9ACTN